MMNFSLFFFSADGSSAGNKKYQLMIEAAKFADAWDFSGIWVPERHFDAFGGLYPNPSVVASALAMITKEVKLRSGSVVLPLQDPLRVAEEWSVVDNLSNGRVELAFASGWHVDDFALNPEAYLSRREITLNKIQEFIKLWSGDTIARINGEGKMVNIRTYPRPLQTLPPMWLTSQSEESFVKAGELGMNILTNFTGKRIEDLAKRIRLYKRARLKHGLNPDSGKIALMMHTFLGKNEDVIKKKVAEGYGNYVRTNLKLQRKHFEAIAEGDLISDDDLVDNAIKRLFLSNGLIGTPKNCYHTVMELIDIGVTEIACLIDFGIAVDDVIDSLPLLKLLKESFHITEN